MFVRASIRLVSALLLALSSAGLPAVAWSQTVTEFALPGDSPAPGVIAAGSDGNLWFAVSVGTVQAGVGRITPAGEATLFILPGSGKVTFGMAAGPDGNLWFTAFPAEVGRITPSGTITEFPLPDPNDFPLSITPGPDGNLWFAEGDRIGRITTAGVVTEFPLGGGLGDITAGPDGNIWFTEGANTDIGRMTPAGVLTEFPPPSPTSFSGGIAPGPDGNVWFDIGDGNANAVGRITPAGLISIFPIPVSESVYIPFRGDMTLGPDGNLWFTGARDALGRITPKGVMTFFKVNTTSGPPGNITAGPDGNLWFTEDHKIARFSLPAPGPCVPDERTLCLTNGRFSVTAAWRNQFNGESGVALAKPSTDLAGFFYFTDPANTELMLKILDFGDATKVFYGQLTNLEFTLRVFDTRTGREKTYKNGPGNCGAIDDNAFAAAAIDTGKTAVAGRCVPGANRLCLLDQRFSVELAWRNQYNGGSGAGRAISLSNLTGSFSFDDPRNLELLVKVLDLGNRVVVLYGSLSNLEYTLTVVETATGKVKSYFNPAGTFCGGLDNDF